MTKSTQLLRVAWITMIVAMPLIAANSDGTDLDDGFDHRPLDEILRQTVRNEWIDYRSILNKYRPQLTQYLDELAGFDPAPLKRDQQLALYINLYNATVIDGVAARYRKGFRVSEKNFAFFKRPVVRIAGRTLTLNDLEHKIIRPTFKEPRAHAALVCAARSCPPLLTRAYHAKDLDKVLDDNMRRFVNDMTRNRVDRKKRELRLSKIFEWYADDFGGAGKLAAYFDRYHPDRVASYRVSFIEYSWELNDAPKPGVTARS